MAGLLQGHIAAITGAGSGIGRAIALGFAREGAKVAVLDIDGAAAADTANAITAAGGTAVSIMLDVTDRPACDAAAASVERQLGQVSVLVNDAGITRRNAFTADPDTVAKDWQDIIGVNLNGMFNVTQAFLAPLRAAKGRIINIASVQSFVHLRTPTSTAYTTSKHGVLGFTKALAAELGKEGVRVNCIGPGFIETAINAQTRANHPEYVKVFLDHTPLGRAGKPEDIVGPAIFLASDLSAFVTGSILMADGGYRTI
jgi:NAD(P)-dependent dehydrogenase (short-subunit alcohol dehydrogenase family)